MKICAVSYYTAESVTGHISTQLWKLPAPSPLQHPKTKSGDPHLEKRPLSTDLFFCQLSARGANFPCHCCRPHRKSVAIMVLQDLLSLHEHRGFVMSHRDFLQPPGSVRFSRSASRDKIRVTAEEVLPCREGKTTSKTWTLSKALICHWGFLCCSFLSGMCVFACACLRWYLYNSEIGLLQ
ncbi:uncharacterized protein LOC142571810 isoform X2 [Dermacentor variabilis]